jgi:tyrosyl-tRNA synthetase
MSKMDKIDLITDEIDEIIGEELLIDILSKRDLNIYWGTTPKSLPHILYFLPILRIVNFVKHNCNVKILIADLHAYLDMLHISFEVTIIRTEIHIKILEYLFKFLKNDMEHIKFIQGSSYQTTQEYTMDIYRFNSLCKVSQVKKAGELVVSQINSEDPLMTSLLYPTLQALDIEYLKADVFFGDSNQKEICLLANNILDKMNYKKKSYFLNNIYMDLKKLPKITFLDTYEEIKEKVDKISLINLVDYIHLIILEICKITNMTFKINIFEILNIHDVQRLYNNKDITIGDIREAITIFFNMIIEPLRDILNDDIYTDDMKIAGYK